ncbi:thiamine phosphate synthase [Aquimarina sp. 2201CG5-10]|uniref:thiamine phosphate synthase n=1 Tax=Aquimarina callyspongiae TaxID=3098150 RepID=UPI002AB52388|nr:thiamine phosphate synthase [Aquimarina sp. 2201CG5-10]MDY8135025.1 thiamine phosphate synthase [Aquimarina sp. 2201CG5-10]
MIRIQYISQGNTPEDHLYNIEQVCKAGGRWIQLRLKDVDMATYLNTALKCREICDQYDAIMIINDNVGVAKAALADGVHLGLEDMNPIEARKVLGENYIIGGTANTLENCMQHIVDKVDYIGLGPFRHTTTKKKLSPILGAHGYQEILSEIRNQNSEIPIVAIGGIKIEDIETLIQSGVSGIAVSGMLTDQKDLEQKIENIRMLIAQPLKANS